MGRRVDQILFCLDYETNSLYRSVLVDAGRVADESGG